MSSQGDNSSDFLQRLKRWAEICTPVIGFLVALIGFIKLALSDTPLVAKVLIIFFIVVLLVYCGYVYFIWKPNKILRRIALAGMFIISISIATFGLWQKIPTKDIIILLADFETSGEQKNYRVTKNIFDQLEAATQNYTDVKIKRLNKAISSKKDALEEGGNLKATIVIWGEYGATATTVQLISHFEVLRKLKYLPQIGQLEQKAAVSELNSFKLQTRLSNEMVYLSVFTVGLTRYTASDWDKAITSFSETLKQLEYPINNRSIIYFFRGDSYYNKKDYDRAIFDYNQVLKLDPNDVDAYNNRGVSYDNKKDYDRAISDYNQALKLDPNNVHAYINRGISYYNKKDYDQAISDYNQALKLDPNNVHAYINRGISYDNKKDYDQAISDYNQALKLDPNNVHVYINRGISYNNKKDYDRAISDLNQALKLDPNNVYAYASQCEIYGDKGDYDRAITDCDNAINLSPDFSDPYYNRGNAYKNKGLKDKAQKDFKKVLKLNDDAELIKKARQRLQELGVK
jgi:tetratricopeptide (TPR) repeat protein